MGERKTLEACFESMQKGFAGTVDQLVDHLAEVCGAKKRSLDVSISRNLVRRIVKSGRTRGRDQAEAGL